ncbi:MAG: hypothetical protein KIT22_06015 [Verrucomicrobiae bacterium]|nr:hypothetical protein [Verrucomicrobiae bacterium]
MIRQLHVLTSPPDAWLQELLESLRRQPEVTVEIVDLTSGEPDYARLVEAVFSADSIATW